MKDLSIFCTKIREIRKKQGLSQKEFAQKIGITQNYLSAIEIGNRNPTLEIIDDIILSFDIPPNELWGYEKKDPEKPDDLKLEKIIEIKINEALKNKNLQGFGS